MMKKGIKPRTKKIIYVFASLIIVTVIFTEWAYNQVESKTKNKLYDSVAAIPFRKTGLLLGTSPSLKSGKENPYFTYRIEAAAELYFGGKISNILISGDNSTEEYDEPTAMKEALVKLGVPDSVIFLDFAGFRTIDSVIRSQEIFSRDSVTVISQPFHNTRALFIANYYGLNAVAYNAKDIAGKSGLRQQLRERGARVKLFIDLYLFDYEPHFLGKKEAMP
jgi:SanA protein